MSLGSLSFAQKIKEIETFIQNRTDAIAFLDEIINTDILQIHAHINKYDAISRKELAFEKDDIVK